MIKKVFGAIIIILYSLCVKGQVIYTPMNAGGYQMKYLKADSGFALPLIDTSLGRGVNRIGVIVANPSDSLLYYYNGQKFVPVNSSVASFLTALNKKVDSITISNNNIFYWINGTSTGLLLNKIDSLYLSNDSLYSCIAGNCDFVIKIYTQAQVDSIDSGVVHIQGIENIIGNKTFTAVDTFRNNIRMENSSNLYFNGLRWFYSNNPYAFTSLGLQAGAYNTFTGAYPYGFGNTDIGVASNQFNINGYAITSIGANTLSGYSGLKDFDTSTNKTVGSDMTFMGYNSGNGIITGGGSVGIGNEAGYGTHTLLNSVLLGSSVYWHNPTALNDSSQNDVIIGALAGANGRLDSTIMIGALSGNESTITNGGGLIIIGNSSGTHIGLHTLHGSTIIGHHVLLGIDSIVAIGSLGQNIIIGNDGTATDNAGVIRALYSTNNGNKLQINGGATVTSVPALSDSSTRIVNTAWIRQTINSQTLQKVTTAGNLTSNDIDLYNNAAINLSEPTTHFTTAITPLFFTADEDFTGTVMKANETYYADTLPGGSTQYFTSIFRKKTGAYNDSLYLPDSSGTFVVKVNGVAPDNKGNVTISVGSTQKVDTTNLGSGLVKSNGSHALVLAIAGTDYVVPSGSITGTSSGFTGSLTGDVSGTQGATSVNKINGITLSSLSTGLLKNTTGTGQPSIAVGGTDYMRPGVDSLSTLLLKKDGNRIDTSLLPTKNLYADNEALFWRNDSILFRPANDAYDNTHPVKYDTLSGKFSLGIINPAQKLYQLMGGTTKAEPINGGILNATTSNTVGSGTTYLVAVYLPIDTTITGMKYVIATSGVFTANGAGYEGAALYSVSGGSLTLIDSTGTSDSTMWQGATGVHKKAFTATHHLTAGVYVIAIVYRTNGAATTTPKLACFSNNANDNQQQDDYANSFMTNAFISSTNLPATGTAYSTATRYGIQYYLALY